MTGSEIAAVALCAVMFVVFALWGPNKECSGDCGSCTGASGCSSHGEK